jgi:hypothetical protein
MGHLTKYQLSLSLSQFASGVVFASPSYFLAAALTSEISRFSAYSNNALGFFFSRSVALEAGEMNYVCN